MWGRGTGAERRPGTWGRRGKAALFRCGAVLVGLAIVGVFEAALAILGLPRAQPEEDPFVGFAQIRPLFELDPTGQEYCIARERLEFFRLDSFPAHKDPAEFRIFCLGGSTVLGEPYAIETAFCRWLQIGLAAAQPEIRWRAVNCGGVSYASYRLVPILEEVLAYQPDLIILYTGQNEFLEDRTYHHLKQMPRLIPLLHQLLLPLRTYRLARAWIAGPSRRSGQERAILPAEVDARLDHQGGLADYHWDLQWRSQVMAHYEDALERMVRQAQEAGVPVLLVDPVSNLRDSPPFKSEHAADLAPAALAEWDSLFEEARSHYRTDVGEAVRLLERAIAIDRQYALAHFELGKCLEALGRFDQAKAAFVQAKDYDVCPLRILEPMHEALRRVARRTGVPLVEVRAHFEKLSRDGILGADWLVDHVHPSIEGHQEIAKLLVEEMVRQGLVRLGPNGEDERDRRWDEHLASLPPLYFLQAAERLRGLQRWAAGQVKLRPIKQK